MKGIKKNLNFSLNNKLTLLVLCLIILVLIFSYFCIGKHVEKMSSGSPLQLEKLETTGPNYIYSVDFPIFNDSLLATGSVKDNHAYLINPKNGRVLKKIKHDNGVRVVKISPNNKYLVSAEVGKFRITDIETDMTLLSSRGVTITCMDIDPSSMNLVIGTSGGRVTCYDLIKSLNTRRLHQKWSKKFGKYRSDRYIHSLAITDTGSNIIVGSRDRILRVLDLEEGIEKYTEKVRGRITSVGINPIRNESRRIVFAVYITGRPGKIMLYELGDITRKIKTINHKTSREMKGLVFFNNKYIITGGSNAVLSIFDISTGKIVQSVNMGSNNFIYSIDLSQRNQLAVGSYRTKLSLYNVIGNKPEFGSRGDGSGGKYNDIIPIKVKPPSGPGPF